MLKSEDYLRRERLQAEARWSHKNEGTAQTHDYASRTREGALVRLYTAGSITADQLEHANEIGSVIERIHADVHMGIINYEPRIDRSTNQPILLLESIRWVRLEMAYGWWRPRAPSPIAAVIAMLGPDPMPFSTAALVHRMHKRKARRILIDAIDLWPEAKDWAERQVDDGDLAAAHYGLLV